MAVTGPLKVLAKLIHPTPDRRSGNTQLVGHSLGRVLFQEFSNLPKLCGEAFEDVVAIATQFDERLIADFRLATDSVELAVIKLIRSLRERLFAPEISPLTTPIADQFSDFGINHVLNERRRLGLGRVVQRPLAQKMQSEFLGQVFAIETVLARQFSCFAASAPCGVTGSVPVLYVER